MSRVHAELVVRFLNGHTDSVDDQVRVLIGMDEESLGPASDGIRRRQVEDELGISLEFRARTSLRNLIQIGLIERDPASPDDLRTFVIAEWIGPDGEIVNGRVAEVAEEAIEALIHQIHDTDLPEGESGVVADGSGVPLRQVLSDGLDIPVDDVEANLRSGDLLRNLREAVQVVEEHPVVSTRDDYGMMIFRNEAYRYRLTERADTLLRL